MWERSAIADAQSALNAYVRTRVRGFWSGVEVRVQIRAEHYRIPDLTIVRGGKPSGHIISAPPEVTVEALSPHDRAAMFKIKFTIALVFRAFG